MRRTFRRCKRLAMFAAIAGPLVSGALAVEPVDGFLEALWQRRFYDEALDYLELLPSQPSLSEAVKQTVPYLRATTLVESGKGQFDDKARNTQLAKAAELFESFAKSFPRHELAASAKNQIGNILIERGRCEVQSAKGSDHEAARKLFEEARQQFTAAEKELDAEWKKMPKFVAPDDKELQNRKRQLGVDLAQVRMLRASVDVELAKTYPQGGAEARKHLKAAAHGYAALHEAYRTRSAGLLARLWEGRCYQDMGETKQALGCYQELMDLPATPETRTIRTKGTRQALECWTSQGEKKYPEAIERGERWEKESGAGQTDADAMAIRYLTALAYQSQCDTLPAKDPNRKRLAGFARQYVEPVAAHPGEYQRSAKTLLVALRGNKESKDGKDGGKGSAFADAFERGTQALEQLQTATSQLKAADAATDKAATEALQKQKAESTATAIESLQQAISVADAKAPLEDLNLARYYLCFLAWDAGRLYDAAVLGEFLAQRYPDSLPGRQGAHIALAAYVRLYGESKADDKSFETAHIERIADIIFNRWPGQEESDEAALTLLSFAVAQRQIDKALGYLGKISPNSPRRAQAELRAGQALWSAYLRDLQSPAEERPPEAQLDQLKKQAQETLAQGVARLEKAEQVDPTLAAAVFTLAQIYLETGQADKAIEWLENPKVGPLALIGSGNPAAARQRFAAETYKLGLRAYIAAKPPQLKKAQAMMDALEKSQAADPKAAENLTAIYISLGRDLQQHLQQLRKSGNRQELEAVSKAFEVFLDRVTQRDKAVGFGTLNWVGETYYNLGIGFEEHKSSPKAKAYFEKATAAYNRMLELALKDPKYQEQPEGLIGLRLRLADCYRRIGKFDEATKTLLAVLREKPMLLNVQVQAAETYQARGAVQPSAYVVAIMGSDPGKSGNMIWGWNRLSQVAEGNYAKFADTFHLARLNMADARRLFALTQSDADKKTKILENAKHDLWQTYKLHPDLGGEATAARYDRLLKQIQKGLGAKETGLAEFKERDTAAARK